jgi:hypothetical protein
MSKKHNKNALKHGAYTKDIVLPNESAEEFEQLRQEFRLQFNPIARLRRRLSASWQRFSG